MLRVAAHAGDRHLMSAEGALHLDAVHGLRAGPALGGLEDDHRPPGPGQVAVFPGPLMDVADLRDHLVQGRGELLVDQFRLIPGDPVHRVAVALEQGDQLVVGDPGQHGRVGDLVAVQVQDGQHRAVGDRVQELVGVPAGGERPGLRLTVPDDAHRDQVGVVVDRTVGVRQRVPQFAALVDGAGRLRRGVAGDPAGEGELAEQPLHPGRVLADVRVELAVGALEVRVGHDARPAVTRPGHVDHVEVVVADQPVGVRVDQVESWRGPPVAQQPRLDVLGPQRLPEQRVVHQVDLAHRQVVGGAPVGVDLFQFGLAQRRLLGAGLSHGLLLRSESGSRKHGPRPRIVTGSYTTAARSRSIQRPTRPSCGDRATAG